MLCLFVYQFLIAASLSQLFYASPRRGATTGELLAMPSAFLTPNS